MPSGHDSGNQTEEVIAGYRVRSLIAVGGMGRVYRACGPHGEEVALKLLKPELASDPLIRRRFRREARIAQRVTHPHVVPVLDVGEHAGTPFMAQAFIRGGSLERKLKDGVLALEPLMTVVLHVAGGLDALHAAGLVHRDVKPGNILFDEQGVAYIADFGLAKDTQGSVLTVPGQALGSLDYMAPEQVRSEPVSPATDVYALGCVVFACLRGTPPFADRQGMRVLWSHLQDAPPDPIATRPELPAGLGPAILRALEKNPADRPQRASDYARLLAAAAGMEPQDAS